MNAILKFKEGRKIPKAQSGVRTSAPVEETIGDWVRESNRSLFGSGMRWYNRNNPVGRLAISMKEETRVKDANGREWILKPNGTKVLASLRNPATGPDGAYFEEKGPNGQVKKGRWQGGKKVYMTDTQLTPAAPLNTGTTSRPKVDYAAKFSGMNFTDEEKKYMTDAGFDPTNAKSVQEFILSKAAGANLGARKGSGIADGYWGDKSAAAFQALRNQGIFTPKVDEQETPAPVVEQPVDAPDFGYRTSNHYGDGMALKGLGFNNYAGLQAYAKTSTDLFAQDLKKRFGDDVSAWDLAAVEGGLGVSGKYRGGRAGDFGDMARSMADWAGKTNAAYDSKEQASRTGTNGTVYSSPEIMRKFESIKLRPNLDKWIPKTKFDFSNMKFNNIFTGAQTLGSVPTTTPTE